MIKSFQSLVGKWKKEGWLPLTLVQKESLTTVKKKKSIKAGTDSRRDKAGCRFHVQLTLPSLETELGPTGYDTYYITFRKLVHAYISTVVRGDLGVKIYQLLITMITSVKAGFSYDYV